ncbi:hypothetical protein FOL47_007981 [Perkinsus chesapeaki]|uniref:Uncharacterized protein n=1 Tax=Perkinsus chesapeaki TaxID=330153 RepID=A0A7J6LHU7_PERCH|nr:hypothetical protein FOL47_007981 [Perkinsus chesapeaki]
MLLFFNLLLACWMPSIGWALKTAANSPKTVRRPSSSPATEEVPALKREVAELKDVVSGLLHSYSRLEAHTAKVTNDKDVCAEKFAERLLTVGRHRLETHIVYTSYTHRYGEQSVEAWFHADGTSEFTLARQARNPTDLGKVTIQGPKEDLEREFGELNPFKDLIAQVEKAFKEQGFKKGCETSLEKLRVSPDGNPQENYEWIDDFMSNHGDEIFLKAKELDQRATEDGADATKLDVHLYLGEKSHPISH